MFETSEEKDEVEKFEIGSNACETPICETTLEDINELLSDGYEVDYDWLQTIDNKLSPTGDSDRPVFK